MRDLSESKQGLLWCTRVFEHGWRVRARLASQNEAFFASRAYNSHTRGNNPFRKKGSMPGAPGWGAAVSPWAIQGLEPE